VVLHILGGEFALSETIAAALAQKGVAALFIKLPYYGERRDPKSPRRMIERDPHHTVAGMTQGVLDIRRARQWLSVRDEVNPERIGLTGISLGGIMTALAGSVDPQFERVAIYLAGGHLAESIWERDHPDAERFRRNWEADGGTRESFLQTLHIVDPATYAARLRGRRVLMVASRHDEVIPPSSTVALWDAIDREPELVWLDAGHVTASRYFFRELLRMQDFFQPESSHERAAE
jgi:cephalosporin-C deacetylase-like acetyl esterase